MKAFGIVNIGILPLLLEAMTPGYAQHDQREQESRRPNQEQEAKPERQQPQPNPEQQKQLPRPGKQPQQPRPERPQHQQKPVGQEEPGRPHEPVPTRQAQPASAGRPEEHPQARGKQDRQPQQNAKGQQDQKQKQIQQPQQPVNRPVQQVQHDYENQHRGAWLDRRAHNWQTEHRSWQQRGGYKGYRIPNARYRGSFGSSHSFRMFSFPLLVVSGFPRFQYGGLWFSVMDPWPEYWSDNWYDNDDLYIEFYGGGYYLRNRMHPLDRMALTVFVR